MGRREVLAFALVLACSASRSLAATPSAADTLSFELPGPAGAPIGWYVGPAGTVFLDSTKVHGGRFAARLARDASSPRNFSVLTHGIPVTFSGDTLELRGWLETEDVDGRTGLWLREDASSGAVQFDNMGERNLQGTTGWTEYRIALPLEKNAKSIAFGALLSGRGTVRADDLRLLVDGRPPAEAPARVREPTAVDTDHEFDGGSRLEATSFSKAQVQNLVLLGKVWGFLKYHHPRVTAAKLHWDYELFRILPPVLAARDRDAAVQILVHWLDRVGEPEPCKPCATAPDSQYMPSPSGWIRDRRVLGKDLAERLQHVYTNRDADGEQHYVAFTPSVGNPDFASEAAYASHPFPDAGYRLLALFRFWNIIEYWFPYRDLLDEDWDGVLAEFIPRVTAASTQDEYRLVMIALVARVHDTHANVWNALEVRPPRGDYQLPVLLRPVEGKFVVGAFSDSGLGPASGLAIGDVIRKLDGRSVDSLAVACAPYYGASNEAARRRDIARSLTRGAFGPCRVQAERAGKSFELTTARDSNPNRQVGSTHDLPGETFRLLAPDVAYLKLSSVVQDDAASYVKKAAGTRCFVIDIRNYPSQFVPFALGQHLVEKVTPFARFTRGDAANPGAFRWTPPVEIEPQTPHYGGKVVILVDEVSQSSAEYTTMALRTAPGALVVGSTTAGADGNVSAIPLPGGLRGLISGIGVFYPDKSPTQRRGIEPNLVVRPTVEGIRAGRDEVLEAALERVLGRKVPIITR